MSYKLFRDVPGCMKKGKLLSNALLWLPKHLPLNQECSSDVNCSIQSVTEFFLVPVPVLFSGTIFFWYRYRYFFPGPIPVLFSATIFSGTGTGTIQKRENSRDRSGHAGALYYNCFSILGKFFTLCVFLLLFLAHIWAFLGIFWTILDW